MFADFHSTAGSSAAWFIQKDAIDRLNTLLRWWPWVKVLLPCASRSCQILRKCKSESLCSWFEAYRTFWGSMSQIYKTLDGTSFCTTQKWFPLLYRKLNSRLKSYHVIEWQANKMLRSVPLRTGQDEETFLHWRTLMSNSSLSETAFLL